jgi:acetylornithine deacetylase
MLLMRGKRVHASLANRQHNAIEAMLDCILEISQYIMKNRPELVYNIRDLFSSQAGFVVPERCEGWLDIHVPPDVSVREILTELEELIARVSPKTSGVEMTFRATTIDGGYELPEREPTVEALRKVFVRENMTWSPDAFRSHSDANRMWCAGTKPILLGPGLLEQAHTEDESVSFDQVCRAARLYLEFAKALFVEEEVGC